MKMDIHLRIILTYIKPSKLRMTLIGFTFSEERGREFCSVAKTVSKQGEIA